MSVPFASFTLSTQQLTYQFTISSCNPEQPVSFQVGNEPYDPTRLYQSGSIGGLSSSVVTIVTFPQNPVPTTWDQNPIKLVVYQITPDQGEYVGNSAVFYGYYLQPNAGELGFYLNQEQSQREFQHGQSGVVATINEAAPAIILS